MHPTNAGSRGSIHEALRGQLADARVGTDLRACLEDGGWRIEVGGVWIEIERDVSIEVVSRSAHACERERHFGDHFRVVVALGGTVRLAHGVPEPGICFATIWYTAAFEVITVDFYANG